MFFIFSKVLFYILMPLTWILLFLFVALYSKRPARKKKSLITVIVLLFIFTNPFITNQAWLLWEHPPTSFAGMRHYDAAIILTGFTTQDKSPHDRAYTNKGADRVLQPLRMYKEGLIDKIIISGGSGSLFKNGGSESSDIKKILMCAGVPGHDILMEEQSRNTHENAMFTKVLLDKHPELKNLLLVTSAFHIKRAAGCFKKEGIDTDVFSTDFYTHDPAFNPIELFVPQEQYLYLWQKLLQEILGYVIYKMAGYC